MNEFQEAGAVADVFAVSCGRAIAKLSSDGRQWQRIKTRTFRTRGGGLLVPVSMFGVLSIP